jgi:hypothetical protein
MKRTWKAVRKGLYEVGKALFKAWIAVMLVGYFVVFAALALFAILASIAIAFAGKGDRDNDRGGGGLGGFYLATRLIDLFVRIWFYSELFKSPEDRYRDSLRRDAKRKERRPLHKAVFSFVFGDGDPNAGWDEIEKKAVVAFLQANKGIITMPEFMALTGLPPAEADDRITRYLREFEGSPEVSDDGCLRFVFPGLLRRADTRDRSWGGAAPLQRLEAFSANPAKANRWFAGLNLANLAFGSYFLWGALTPHAPWLLQSPSGRLSLRGGFDLFYNLVADLLLRGYLRVENPAALLGIGLGLVPILFAGFFFAIPALRKLRLERRNEAVKRGNLRRIAYGSVLANPAGVRPEAIPVVREEARPADSGAAYKVLKELAAATGAEVAANGALDFPEIARTQAAAAAARASVRAEDSALGGIAFDSHA